MCNKMTESVKSYALYQSRLDDGQCTIFLKINPLNLRVPEVSSYYKKIQMYSEILSLFEAVWMISMLSSDIQWKVQTDSGDWCQNK